jgi:hypothetical protein
MLTVSAWPAIVAVRVTVAPVFVAAVTVTDPFPSPAAGANVSPESVLAAVHVDGEHPDGVAVTVTTWEPPLDGKDSDVGEVENAQAALTVIVCRPETPCTTAVILVLPGATAAISPPGDTETLLESDDDHCAAAVWSCVVVSESVSRAWHCAVWPIVPSALASQLTASDTGVGEGAVCLVLQADIAPTQANSDANRGNRMFIEILNATVQVCACSVEVALLPVRVYSP